METYGLVDDEGDYEKELTQVRGGVVDDGWRVRGVFG